MKAVAVAEIQGLYGAVSISERVLQRLWLQRGFDQHNLQAVEGARLEILQPGRWNHHEGPDFREARLKIDGQVRTGDVELHFYEQDWFAHGHDSDPAFDQVALHVVLYRGGSRLTRTADGNLPQTLHLLPYLPADLEAIAAEQALTNLIENTTGGLREWLLGMDLEARRARLCQGAATRWRQKCAFARQRLTHLNWTEACHLGCLEVLGYRRNRAPMANLAARYPLEYFAQQPVDALFESQQANWRLSGSRPENHPKKRIAQYQALARLRPDWPAALTDWGKALPAKPPTASTKQFRRRGEATQRKRDLLEGILSGTIGGTRFDTFVVDAALPLLAAQQGNDLADWWFHWFRGDAPDELLELLRSSEVTGPDQPICNGYVQGLLQLMLEEPAG